MPVVQNIIVDPQGIPVMGAVVTISLTVHPAVIAPGYLPSGQGEIQGVTRKVTGSNGTWTAGTVYRIATAIPGAASPIIEYVLVPSGAGPYNVVDILTTQPS
jgi:hypothetical protein